MDKKKLSTRDLCHIGIFTALTVVLAQISIPMPLGVPMTMQTFAISLAAVVLGARKGFLSSLAYILLGGFGLPVFHNFTGGIGIVLGVTGGFILSFPIMAWLIGFWAEKGRPGQVAVGLIIGTVVNYLFGMAYFVVVADSDLRTAFVACVLPFIPTAVVKAAAAGWLGQKLRARSLIHA